MWRSSKTAVPVICRHIFKQPHRCGSGASTSGGGFKVAKALLLTTSAVAVGAGGAVGYAWYDPEFRRTIENNVPQSKDALQTILGAPRNVEKPAIDISSLKEIGEKVSTAATSLIPKRKEQKDELPTSSTASQIKAAPTEKSTAPRQKTPEKDVDPGTKAEKSTEKPVEVDKSKKDFEEELRNQMRRQAAAHSEHLEDALRAQQTQLESKYRRDLDESLNKQLDGFNAEVGSAIGRLKAIDTALEGRAEQDRENRRAKELWLACQQLKKSVLHGRAEGADYIARKKPLLSEISAIKQAGTADPFVKALLNTLKSEAVAEGVYTQEDLVSRFQKVKKVCRRTALVGDNGGTLFHYFLSMVQSWFIFDRVKPDDAKLLEVDPSNIDNLEIISRSAYFVDQLQFASAIRLMLLLQGEPARLASDWIKDARVHLETRRAAELLLAHASAISMRTIY